MATGGRFGRAASGPIDIAPGVPVKVVEPVEELARVLIQPGDEQVKFIRDFFSDGRLQYANDKTYCCGAVAAAKFIRLGYAVKA